MQRYLALDAEADPAVEQELTTLLYPKDGNKTAIQTDLVRSVTEMAEKKSLNVLNFQMLDSIEGPMLSEAAVLIRVSGQIRAAIELLKDILSVRPLLAVRDVEISGSGYTCTVKFIVAGYIRKS
ncbi:General secretion pathway M protein [Candidatus Magnetobacterium bavaricum]|uniref:General secretion pathway M protein n=1 Tax=Candidatus Magnetobacterium bavaricum TaxID=29290 RepID=A0A0F3H3G8_9BACT|nr:General secretion pathway M protein [Candidatus Magnetobacterium bavaricum]